MFFFFYLFFFFFFFNDTATTEIYTLSLHDALPILSGGILMEVSPTKVARVIGKEGSMVSLIKDLTNCRIYVGQNGRIWLDGEDRDTAVAAMAIRLIEQRAQALGLTEAVRELIERAKRDTRGRLPS